MKMVFYSIMADWDGFSTDACLDLTLRFGGEFVHVPTVVYIGGASLVVRNVVGMHMDRLELEKMCAREGIAPVKGFYVIHEGGFLLLNEPIAIGKFFAKAIMRWNRKLTLYVDATEFPEIIDGEDDVEV